MVVLQLLPAALSALVLAAHFLRAGNPALMLASLALVLLMLVRRPWAARVIQIGLSLGTLEWVRTLIVLIAFRKHAGLPFTRLAVILATVAAVTAASALVFRARAARQHFRMTA